MAALRILSTLAIKGILDELTATKPFGETDVVAEPTALLMQRIAAGARGDIAALTAAGIDTLIAQGVLDGASRRDVAVSAVGIAVRKGAPKPDISTADALRALLLSVPSLCYSRAGASGLHFAKVIRQLGIADEVERKATIVPSGFTAEAVVDGRCAIAIQQISELLAVPGIEIAGPLPETLQETLTFSAAIFVGTANGAQAAQFLAAITDAALAPAYARHGLRLSVAHRP